MTELVPAMSVPAICTPNLTQLLAYYRDRLGFQVIQEVRGVLAFVQHGPVRLQLWQRAGKSQGDRRIRLFVQWVVNSVFEPHCR